LSVWDTAVELKLQYCFNPRNGELVTRDDPAPEPSGNDKDPERDGRLVRVLLLHSPSESSAPITQAEQSASAGKGARKWEQWCTADIEVFVDKGPYTGTKGVVFDIISKDSICVFLSGLGEAINLPLSQLAPFKPKAKQRVKVLSGEHKGKDGTMLAVQGTTTAVVRLTTKQIVTIQIGALASMPNPDSDSGDASTTRAYNTCAVALFTLPDASRLTVYELAASEPKYMQSHAFDFHGQALCADYASSSKTVYVAYEQLPPYSDEPIYTLAWFTFDEKQKRLISHAYVVTLHQSSPRDKLF
jgi:ribosomal protein L24